MVSHTGFKILIKLIENDGLASGAFLSESCNLSINTIRNEIDKLNEDLKKYNSSITSHIANGYRLIVKDQEKLNDMVKQHRRFSYLNISENTIAYHLIRELLSTNRYLGIEDLMDELYCSRSTIVRILDKAKKYLEQYDLKIINKKNHGLQIEGSEWNKRLCLIKQEKIKRHDENEYDNEGNFDAMFLLNTDYRRSIRKIIINRFAKEASFFLPQIGLPEVFNMAILNHTRKQYLNDYEPILQMNDIPTLGLAYKIYSDLPQEMKDSWSDNEIKIFAALIASIAYPNKVFLEEKGLLEPYLKESGEVVSYIRQYFELPEVFDELFHENMASYLFRLQQQLRFSKSNDSEHLSESFSKGIVSADICSCLGLWYFEKYGVLLSGELLAPAYYIINRVLAMNRTFYHPFEAVVMSRYGLYYAQNIAERLKMQYPEYIKGVDCTELCYLDDYDWESKEILFSDLFFNSLPTRPPKIMTIPIGSLHDPDLFGHFDAYLKQYILLDALELFPKEYLRYTFAASMEEIYDEIYDICNDEVGDKERFIRDLRLHGQMTGNKRVKGIVCLSNCALRTKEAMFSVVVSQKPILCDDAPSSVFIFYSYGNGSVRNRYLISWLIQRFYNKSEDYLNTMFQRPYQSLSEEL